MKTVQEMTYLERWKRARLLYKRYKTDSWEYAAIARSFGMTTTELNGRLHPMNGGAR